MKLLEKTINLAGKVLQKTNDTVVDILSPDTYCKILKAGPEYDPDWDKRKKHHLLDVIDFGVTLCEFLFILGIVVFIAFIMFLMLGGIK